MGGAALPLLPVARGSAEPAPVDDATSCEYWRHCAIDGFLCACCGGSATACPPGTEMSPVTWIGTCRNPGDGRDYLISYNDCCGKGYCGRCFCNRNEGDRPDLLSASEQRHQLVRRRIHQRLSLLDRDRAGRRRAAAAREVRAAFAIGLACLAASGAAAQSARETDYALQCQGCHGAEGAGVPGRVPPLSGVAALLETPAGRARLLSVPGVRQASLSDARLATLLEWVATRFAPPGAERAAPALTSKEVARLR